VSLALAVAGGLGRLIPGMPGPGTAIAWHGALMVTGFFGTVISLERAAAMRSLWPYAAPLAAGTAGLLIALGAAGAGFVLMLAAALVLCAANIAVAARQRSLETVVLAAGALAWLAGNAIFLRGDGTPWWIAFFVLTIAAERLELSRYAKRPAWTRPAFAVLALMLLLLPLVPEILGASLAALALWLAAFDLARVTVRQHGLPRYIAVCLLAGYFWLFVSGVLFMAHGPRDAALHAVFLGFVFSMIFGHAPVILPAALRLRLPYHPVLYLPLALLHASLAVRLAISAPAGALGNAAAIALFVVLAAALVARGEERWRLRD
jgi:hypothetical protein